MALRFKRKRSTSLYGPPQQISQIIIQKPLPKLNTAPLPSGIANKETPKEKPSSKNEAKEKSKSSSKEPIVDREITNVISISANKHFVKGEISIPSLPPLPSLSDPKFNQIFQEKIKLCNIIFDFSKPKIQQYGKSEKLNALIEINKLLSKITDNSTISESQKDLLFEMIMKNIFEQDPFISTEKGCNTIANPSIIEPSWEHLCHVYQVLIQYIILFPNRVKLDLIKNVIRLLNIPDNSERENLLSILQNYSKSHPNEFNPIFILLKSSLNNVLTKIYTAYCVEPILAFFKNSIKLEFVHAILYTHLLPLYRHDKLFLFSGKLTSLVVKSIESRYTDRLKVLAFLIDHFPVQNCQKQVIFASVINSILAIMSTAELKRVSAKLIGFLCVAVRSSNSKLAETALKILFKPTITQLIYKNIEKYFLHLAESLHWSASYHWDKNIRTLSKKALAALDNIKFEVVKNPSFSGSPEFFKIPSALDEGAFRQYQEESSHEKNRQLITKWAIIARCASKKYKSIDLTKSLLQIQSNLLNGKQIT